MSDPFAPPPAGFPNPYGDSGAPPSNGVAVAAMVVGILAMFPAITIVFAFFAVVPGFVAIILGAIGLSRANQHTVRPGKGMAITGIVCGVLTFVALIVEVVFFVWLGSSDFELSERRIAAPDDYELSDRVCIVDGDEAVAGGGLTNRSGATAGFAVVVRFQDGEIDLGPPQTTELEGDLPHGATWVWEVTLPLDPAADVNTDGLNCRIVQVDIGDSVSTD